MDFVEQVRVSQERAEAQLRAEIDRPPAMLDTRKIRGIRVAEYPSAKRYELPRFLLFERCFRH